MIFKLHSRCNICEDKIPTNQFGQKASSGNLPRHQRIKYGGALISTELKISYLHLCYKLLISSSVSVFMAGTSRSLGNGVRKNSVRNRVRIDDVWSILKFRIGFPFGENSAGFCKSVGLPGSILNFRIGSASSIGGLIAATLFAATVADSQN